MKIKIDLDYPIQNGSELVFKSPCDYSWVDGLIVYYPEGTETVSKEFAFADANVNDLSGLDVLFANGAVVKVILDLDTNMAFVQNADTNAYLEGRFADIEKNFGENNTTNIELAHTEGYDNTAVVKAFHPQSMSAFVGKWNETTNLFDDKIDVVIDYDSNYLGATLTATVNGEVKTGHVDNITDHQKIRDALGLDATYKLYLKIELDSVEGINVGMTYNFSYLSLDKIRYGKILEIEDAKIFVNGETGNIHRKVSQMNLLPVTSNDLYGNFIIDGGRIGTFEIDSSVGVSAHIEGIKNFATIGAHAEGNETWALAFASHTEGRLTEASGDGSHAEGAATKATGHQSHSEGELTKATGYAAHAEGNGSEATGDCAHAEGSSSHASGYGSHAEGRSTASDNYAHAEGYITESNGYASHSEGRLTKATKDFAHSEGNTTEANGQSSHAEGMNTKAENTATHTEGYGAVASGLYAHAEGDRTQAIGITSHAEGRQTTAKGDHSHTEGFNTQATGVRSHAEGDSTTASEQGAHSEGINSRASGIASHAEGEETYASGARSHAEGYNTWASGSRAHSEGEGTKASGESAHAEGRSTEARGQNSHAEGMSTLASGLNSHAEGTNTWAKGEASHAEGIDSHADGKGSHAEGMAIAKGVHSHGEGSGCAEGNRAHAEGEATYARGINAHAEGKVTEANGDCSHSEGKGTRANGECQHVQGKFNVVDNDNEYAHIVGNGTSDGNRSNAHTIDWNGNAWFAGKIKSGNQTVALLDANGKLPLDVFPEELKNQIVQMVLALIPNGNQEEY